MADKPLFDTVDEAKAYAEGGAHLEGEGRGLYHVFVYCLDKQFGVLWHSEDKYIHSYVPFGAVVCWHGDKNRDETKPDEWAWLIAWESRDSNFNQNDHDVLVDVMGKNKGEAFWSLLTDDEEQ